MSIYIYIYIYMAGVNSSWTHSWLTSSSWHNNNKPSISQSFSFNDIPIIKKFFKT